jgi:regulator of replication initiation timing
VYINDLNLEKTKLKERIINLVNLNKRKDTVKKRLRKCDWTKDELNRLYNGLQEYNNCGNNISRIINDFKYGFFLLEMSKTLKIILKITQKRTFLY